MKRLAVIVCCLAACSDGSEAPTAYLSALEAVAPDGARFDLLNAPDASAMAHSPLATVRATFSALLEPNKVQDLSGSVPRPGAGVAKVVWHRPEGTFEVPLTAVYNPARTLAGGAAPTVTFSPDPALPADAALTLVMDPQRLVNKAGVPYVGPRQADFQTAPFAIAVSIPAAPVAPDFVLRVTFSSVPATFAPGAVRVVRADGSAVEVEVVRDAGSAFTWLVSPAGEAVPWPAGRYTLQLDANILTDTYGVGVAGHLGPWPFTVGDGRTRDDAGSDAAGPG